MIALVAILAWLPMPLDPITSPHDVDWYAPVELLLIEEPTIQEIEREWKRKHIRILEAGPECRE
jgi:hypothetical protein